jgi:soluble lytic murein transglycosylase-like protein
LGISLIGAWACSSVEGTEATLEGKAAPIERAAPALSVRWLPPALTLHEAALVDAAHRHGLAPELLAIIALVESLGDTRAQSPSGARGLMQLMPTTAARIAQERQIAGHSDERLFELEYSLDLGAWYLSQQLAEFGAGRLDARAVELAAVAYNGGPELARAYVAGEASLWPETKRYSELVVALWNERQDAESQTFEAWRERMSAGR